MKKDKKWLKEQIERLSYTPKGLDENSSIISKNWVLNFTDQLDEPDERIQLEEAYKDILERHIFYYNKAKYQVIKESVIPQFVADYIEKWEDEGLTIYEWFSFGNNDVDEDVNKWLYDNTMEENRRREYLLVNAIRNGYEVEKEPYYYVAFEGDSNLLYVTHVDIYGENGKFNYSSEFDKNHALKFTDKSKAKYLADFLGATVLEEKK